MNLVVYTAVFGHTDPLMEPTAPAGARFVCFTDQPIKSKQWEIVQMASQEAPTRAARTIKLNPHQLFPEADATLWMDACFSLKHPFAKLLERYPEEIVTFRHRDRQRIVDEAHQIALIGKARPIDTYRQLSAYQADGFDTVDNPMTELSCNGVVMRRNTPAMAEFGELWTRQIEQFTLRDQMSADYVAWKLGTKIGRWDGAHNTSPHFGHKLFKRPVNDY